jgi:hypothetical protein
VRDGAHLQDHGHDPSERDLVKRAHGVFRAVERAPLPPAVAMMPYFQWSRQYKVSTPSGTFTCRREPDGLAGSEHNIRRHRGSAHVSWDTVHD